MTILSKGTPTNFELVIPLLPYMKTLEDSESISLHLYETVIPAISIETTDRYWMGIKVDSQACHNIVYEDWTINFTVDAKLTNWLTLYKWVNYITTGLVDQNGHINPREEKSHLVNCTLIATDNFKNPVFNVDFIDVWIQSLGEIRYSNRSGEMILESSAILKYSYYTIKQLN